MGGGAGKHVASAPAAQKVPDLTAVFDAVKNLQSPNGDVKRKACAYLVRRISATRDDLCQPLLEHGGIEALIIASHSRDADDKSFRRNALQSILFLASCKYAALVVDYIQRENLFPSVIKLLYQRRHDRVHRILSFAIAVNVSYKDGFAIAAYESPLPAYFMRRCRQESLKNQAIVLYSLILNLMHHGIWRKRMCTDDWLVRAVLDDLHSGPSNATSYEISSCLLAALTRDARTHERVCTTRGIELVVELMRTPVPTLQLAGCLTAANISFKARFQRGLIYAGAVPPLVAIISKSEDTIQMTCALRVLRHLVRQRLSRPHISKLLLPRLQKLSSLPRLDPCHLSSLIMSILSSDPDASQSNPSHTKPTLAHQTQWIHMSLKDVAVKDRLRAANAKWMQRRLTNLVEAKWYHERDRATVATLPPPDHRYSLVVPPRPMSNSNPSPLSAPRASIEQRRRASIAHVALGTATQVSMVQRHGLKTMVKAYVMQSWAQSSGRISRMNPSHPASASLDDASSATSNPTTLNTNTNTLSAPSVLSPPPRSQTPTKSHRFMSALFARRGNTPNASSASPSPGILPPPSDDELEATTTATDAFISDMLVSCDVFCVAGVVRPFDGAVTEAGDKTADEDETASEESGSSSALAADEASERERMMQSEYQEAQSPQKNVGFHPTTSFKHKARTTHNGHDSMGADGGETIAALDGMNEGSEADNTNEANDEVGIAPMTFRSSVSRVTRHSKSIGGQSAKTANTNDDNAPPPLTSRSKPRYDRIWKWLYSTPPNAEVLQPSWEQVLHRAHEASNTSSIRNRVDKGNRSGAGSHIGTNSSDIADLESLTVGSNQRSTVRRYSGAATGDKKKGRSGSDASSEGIIDEEDGGSKLLGAPANANHRRRSNASAYSAISSKSANQRRSAG
mmetsp:Transcript_43997/g.71588  ORF Transcript_43997/g.71588 Transcript_43997/m.71588 type:complete len:912 (-) Transcript_43997:247-2982(-)